MFKRTMTVIVALLIPVAILANVPVTVIDVTKAKQKEDKLDIFTLAFRNGGADYKSSVKLRPGALCNVQLTIRKKKGYEFLGGNMSVRDTEGRQLLSIPIPKSITKSQDDGGNTFVFSIREDLLRTTNISLGYRDPQKTNRMTMSDGDNIRYNIDISSYLKKEDESNKAIDSDKK